jgi:ribonuclease I
MFQIDHKPFRAHFSSHLELLQCLIKSAASQTYLFAKNKHYLNPREMQQNFKSKYKVVRVHVMKVYRGSNEIAALHLSLISVLKKEANVAPRHFTPEK